jgi:hypothetical protein
MPENTLYHDSAIRITDKTIVIGRTTIFLKNINSVTLEPSSWNRVAPLIVALGIIVLLMTLSNGGGAIIFGCTILVGTIAAAWFVRGFSDLVFDTSSGRVRQLQNVRTDYLEQIRKLTTDAITHS